MRNFTGYKSVSESYLSPTLQVMSHYRLAFKFLAGTTDNLIPQALSVFARMQLKIRIELSC